jgi:hypothetical protein
MHKRLLLTVGLVVTVVVGLPPALARQVESWPYGRLFKEADVIVIATAERTSDTKDRPKTRQWKLVGQVTVFSVQRTLKGKVEGPTVRVLHFRLPRGKLAEDGPLLVSFRTKSGVVKRVVDGVMEVAQVPKGEYLLFLKARKDGRYEPVSGPIDPAFSVRELLVPSPLARGE